MCYCSLYFLSIVSSTFSSLALPVPVDLRNLAVWVVPPDGKSFPDSHQLFIVYAVLSSVKDES